MLSFNTIRRLLALAVVPLIGILSASAADHNWPQWRGPKGDSVCTDTNIPKTWDASSIVWKVSLKGSGQSSPVVWGDRIFLTTALEKGKTRLVICIDRKNGQTLWEKEAWTGEPEKTHDQNGWATATCATDGERVVAFFGKGGLHCYDMDGKPLWSRNLGDFPGIWGTAASPIIVGDLVIQNCDAAGVGLLLAVNKTSGKDVWKTPRSAPERGGWTTPVLVKSGDHQELVVNGETSVTGYDIVSGKQLWSCKSYAGRGDPTVTPGDGICYVINGQPGDIYAVKTGGKGDVSKSHQAWHTARKSGRDQPSPILIGDSLIVTSMTGVTTQYDAKTGKVVWTGERLKGTHSSSPIAANGLAYFQNEAGETSVVKPGPSFELVATNSLGASGEVFRASLTPSNGQIFSRSDKTLYCIGASKK